MSRALKYINHPTTSYTSCSQFSVSESQTPILPGCKNFYVFTDVSRQAKDHFIRYQTYNIEINLIKELVI